MLYVRQSTMTHSALKRQAREVRKVEPVRLPTRDLHARTVEARAEWRAHLTLATMQPY